MKIIVKDNFDVEYESLVCENIQVESVAASICEHLNKTEGENFYFVVVADDYVLR